MNQGRLVRLDRLSIETGIFQNHEPEAIDTDEWAIAHNFVSVVPVTVDMTAHWYLDKLKVRFKK